MSRRYSDAPINLIARIPTPEQMSAARPKKRSFGQAVMESGATCVRSLAELSAQLSRLLRAGASPPAASSGQESMVLPGEAKRVSRSDADGDTTVATIPFQTEAPAVVPIAATSEPAHQDVAALRAEVVAQQLVIDRLSMQVQELKSMVGAQQQVLLHLGRELELHQTPVVAAAMAPHPVPKAQVVKAKSSPKSRSASRKPAVTPSLNL